MSGVGYDFGVVSGHTSTPISSEATHVTPAMYDWSQASTDHSRVAPSDEYMVGQQDGARDPVAHIQPMSGADHVTREQQHNIENKGKSFLQNSILLNG